MLEVLGSGEKVLEKAANLGEIGGDRLVMGSMSVVVWMMVPLSFSRCRLVGETIGCTPIFPEKAGVTGWGALSGVWVRLTSRVGGVRSTPETLTLPQRYTRNHP